MQSIKHYIFALVCVLLGSTFYSYGQLPHFRSHKILDDIAEGQLTKVFQDKKGFMWMATSEGLFMFNGIEQVEYHRPDKKKEAVTAIAQDRKGRVWAGYADGYLGYVIGNRLVSFLPEEGIPVVEITDLAQDKKGNLWIGTYGEGIYCFTGKRLYNINTDDGLKDNFIYDIVHIEKTDEIWAGTDGGIAICQFNNQTKKKKIKTLTMNEGLPDNIIMSFEVENDIVWIGTQANGVCKYDLSSKKIEESSIDNWSFGAVHDLLSYEGELWMGTSRQGVAVYDKTTEQLQFYDRTNSPISSRVECVEKDIEGNVWIADNSASVFITNPSFRFIKLSLMQEAIHAIYRDSRGYVWFTTDNGFMKMDLSSGKKEAFTSIKPISIHEDKYGYLWLGTFGDGVYRMNPTTGRMRKFTTEEGLINGNILSIAGNDSTIWFSTLGGVSKCTIEGNADAPKLTFRSYEKTHGLGTNFIYQVFIDSKGRVWFATDGKGITLYDKGVFTNYSQNAGLKSLTVYSITEDADGKIWFSTADDGIYSFDGKNFKHFTERQGLKDLKIASVAADKYGNLLILRKNGIDVLKTKTGQIFTYGAESGINYIDPSLNATHTDGQGNIWIAGQTGIIRYTPTQDSQSRNPLTQINNILVFMRDTATGVKEFSYNQNHISFDYVGLWYQSPEEVLYRIKLEGFDQDWSISKNHYATYSNLPAGEYTFKVQSSLSREFKNVPTASYSFTINPPFWNTIWFYVLSFAGTAFGLVYFIRTREKRLRQNERLEKDKVEFQFETLKSQVNPHFLFNSFNTLVSIIEKDQDTAVEYVEKLSDFYRNVLLYRQQDLIPLKVELELIEQYFFLQQKRYKDNLVLNVNIADEHLDYLVAPLTLQLLLENAIKHNIISKDKPLTIEISSDGIYLSVTNNLQVKKVAEPSTGLGLQNIINRYRLLCKQEVIISKDTEYYIVRIPLIKHR